MTSTAEHPSPSDETATAGPAAPAPPARKPRATLARWVFWPAAGVILAVVLVAVVAPEATAAVVAAIQASVISTFSWYYVLIAALFVAFTLWVGFSRFGDIRLGKDDDEPQFSLLSWFALLFAAGMGIGLVFWGAAEPLNHFANPRPGVTGTEAQLAQSAMSQTFLHWGVHAWAIYVVVGLALAYAVHRRGRPVSIRWALEPLLGRRVRGGWGNAIDVVALVGTVFGVATSLGLGVLQISAGLEHAGIVESSLAVQIVVILLVTALTVASLVSGLDKGMKWLSNFNLLLASALLVFLLVVGPTQFLLRDFVQSIGNYLGSFISLSFNVSAYAGAEGEAFQSAWTTYYWGWWMSWAPFVGVFIARVSKGRTVREFVAGVLLVPTLLTMLWFSIVGGTALHRELYGEGGLVGADGSVDTEASLFDLLAGLPGSAVLVLGAIVLIAVFFVTSSDSGALVMAMIASGGDTDPRRSLRVFFAGLCALLAIALLLVGGLSTLQTAAILSALPFSVVMLLMCVATSIAFRRERRAYDRAQRAQFRDHIGEFYGLEVERDAPLEPRFRVRRPRLGRRAGTGASGAGPVGK